jgi:hypothetical protein
MPQIVKTPDGKEHVFPDEATPDQMKQALSSYLHSTIDIPEGAANENGAAPQSAPMQAPELQARTHGLRAGQDPAPREPSANPTLLERGADMVTGNLRATPETQQLPDWVTMPELNEMSLGAFKTGLGTMMSSPEETVQIIKANFPNTQVRQDEKGNFLLRSSIDGQEYAIKPGLTMGDVPRILGGLVAFMPAGKAATAAGAALAGAGTQAAIEGTQVATGGNLDNGEVATAGLLGGAGKLLEKYIGAAKSPFRRGGSAKEAAPAVVAAAPEAPVAPAAAATGLAPEEAQKQVGELLKKATSRSPFAKSAQRKLAEMADVNPEAKAAADRLGIDLPADVFSDNPQIRSAAGLTRSAAGSDAEASWRNTVSKAVDRADELMRDFDAQYVEGSVSPATASDKIRGALTSTREALNKEASDIYERVNEAVPKNTPVTFDALNRTLGQIVEEVGESGLSAQERAMMKMAQDNKTTYGRLIREKNLIGQAIKGKDSPYGNMEAGALKRLYGALAEDQLANVGAIGGEELRRQLSAANLIYGKERALGERITDLFGADEAGSIAGKLRSVITGAAKGDAGDFNRLLDTVPEDLRKEAVATALASVARSNRGAEKGAFGFAEYADLYPKLRSNPVVFKRIADTLGPEATSTMRDLFDISRRITDARANVLQTGKANQALKDALAADGLVSKILSTTAGRAATSAAGSIFGPAGGAVSSVAMDALATGGKDAVKAAGKLFASDEFQRLATEAAKGKATPAAVNGVANSGAFRSFVKASRLNLTPQNSVQWLTNAMQSAKNFDEEKPQ